MFKQFLKTLASTVYGLLNLKLDSKEIFLLKFILTLYVHIFILDTNLITLFISNKINFQA